MPRATPTPANLTANLDSTRTKTCFLRPSHQEPGAAGEGAPHDEACRTTITRIVRDRLRVARLAAGTHAGRLQQGGSSTTATTPPATVGSPRQRRRSPAVPRRQRRPSSIGDGVYLVGTDIPAGLYKGTTVSYVYGAWQIARDANGSSIIASDLTTSGQFYVQVEKGQYLELSGVEIVKAAAAAPTRMRSSVRDGVYLVGTDIPAGSYRGTMSRGNRRGLMEDIARRERHPRRLPRRPR